MLSFLRVVLVRYFSSLGNVILIVFPIVPHIAPELLPTKTKAGKESQEM